MSDGSSIPPAPGDNLPPITKIASEMASHAQHWALNAAHGEKHEREIMVRAYRLCLLAEDPNLKLMIVGIIAQAKVPQTKRSHICTQLINYAFHNVNDEREKSRRTEKSMVSRWSGA